eukprot:CAMPEP_0115006284 /NCGR_PEP_ID=MMETSP0216-20121206/20404_1 /TAXON_ID=223996 /ORGANISM="Protocruzia adherens, Strain Boccale" /LENGTH=439 /DNA_ID=CAMNT_0002372829 /DNA_START=184 /DNA_END=1503 /DNA_ORIENTATION=+
MKSVKRASSIPSGRTLVLRVSPLGEYSNSNKVINRFLSAYQNHFPDDTIVEKDISDGGLLKPYTAKRVMAKFSTWAGGKDAVEVAAQEEWRYTKELAEEFASFHKVIIGSPTWNFSVANQLKKYFDHIIQPNLTFDPATLSGKLGHMSALVVASAGSEILGGPMDFNIPMVKSMLALMGIADIRTIEVNGTANMDNLSTLLEAKYKEAEILAEKFHHDPSAALYTGINRPRSESTETVPKGKKVLHVVSSPLGEWSASHSVAAKFLEEYKQKVPDSQVTTLDLTSDTPQPFNALRVQAKFTSFTNEELQGAAKEEWDYTLNLISDFKEYDTYVFSVPMWNWGLPSHLKLYIDHLVQPFQTFDPRDYSGLLSGKKAYVINSAGGPSLGGPFDVSSNYLTTVLGLMGIKDVNHVNVNGLSDQANRTGLIAEGTRNAIELLQ